MFIPGIFVIFIGLWIIISIVWKIIDKRENIYTIGGLVGIFVVIGLLFSFAIGAFIRLNVESVVKEETITLCEPYAIESFDNERQGGFVYFYEKDMKTCHAFVYKNDATVENENATMVKIKTISSESPIVRWLFGAIIERNEYVFT